MAQHTLFLYGTGDGGQDDGVASLDIPQDGVIEGVSMHVNGDLDADQDFVFAELSFIATNQSTVNDSRSLIALAIISNNLTTSGAHQSTVNHYIPMDIDVSGGERLYLNILASASLASSAFAIIYFRPKGGMTRRDRRR